MRKTELKELYKMMFPNYPEDKRNQLCTWRGGEADWIS